MNAAITGCSSNVTLFKPRPCLHTNTQKHTLHCIVMTQLSRRPATFIRLCTQNWVELLYHMSWCQPLSVTLPLTFGFVWHFSWFQFSFLLRSATFPKHPPLVLPSRTPQMIQCNALRDIAVWCLYTGEMFLSSCTTSG